MVGRFSVGRFTVGWEAVRRFTVVGGTVYRLSVSERLGTIIGLGCFISESISVIKAVWQYIVETIPNPTVEKN